jgi:hypothetical protein
VCRPEHAEHARAVLGRPVGNVAAVDDDHVLPSVLYEVVRDRVADEAGPGDKNLRPRGQLGLDRDLNNGVLSARWGRAAVVNEAGGGDGRVQGGEGGARQAQGAREHGGGGPLSSRIKDKREMWENKMVCSVHSAVVCTHKLRFRRLLVQCASERTLHRPS